MTDDCNPGRLSGDRPVAGHRWFGDSAFKNSAFNNSGSGKALAGGAVSGKALSERRRPDDLSGGTAPGDEEEAEIRAMITTDDDATDDAGIPADESLRAVFPHLAAQQAPQMQQRGHSDTPVAVPVDADIVERYRAGGIGWQQRLNADLRRLLGLDG